MKSWVLAESASGYIWNWKLYTGRAEKQGDFPPTTQVVLDLTEDIHYKGYNFYFDNYYTSPLLCKTLYDYGSGSCGTVRTTRKGIPKEFRDKKLSKGEITTYSDLPITGIKWMDKRPVSLLSTIHDDSVTRRSRFSSRGIEMVQKPVMIQEYNKYMGGVDKADQLVTYYGFPHTSKKWWKRVFFHLLDTTIVNAYIMYNQGHQHLTLKKIAQVD